MAWFKVDDGFYTSHKVLMIPREHRHAAIGAWLIAGTWSADKMTDGVVPSYVLEDLGVSPDAQEWLCRSGLWDQNDDGSIYFHDWCEYQPTKEQLEAKSKVRAQVGSLGGIKSGEARRSKSEAKRSKVEANANPEPEPEPEPFKEVVSTDNRTRKTSLKADWKPSETGLAFAMERAPAMNIDVQVEKFMNYNLHSNRTSANWDAAWRTWVIKAVEFDPSLAIAIGPPKRIFRAGEDDV